jgi:hypothetical protein
VLEHYGAAIGAEGPYLTVMKDKLKISFPSLSDDALHRQASVTAKLQTVAIGFMKRADKLCYGELWSDLENNYTRG